MGADVLATLREIELALKPFVGRLFLLTTSPLDRLVISVTVLRPEQREAARQAVNGVIAAHGSAVAVDGVYAYRDDALRGGLWSALRYFDGLHVLTDYLRAVAAQLPAVAPPDVNGMALYVTGHHADVLFSTRTGVAAVQGKYRTRRQVRGADDDVVFVRTHPEEWESETPWVDGCLHRLPEQVAWYAWTASATRLIEEQEDLCGGPADEIYGRWMLGICYEAIRRTLPDFLALPNTTEDFVAFVKQHDVDNATHFLDLAATVGFERASALMPKLP